jgi:tellurite resistance protein TerC
VNVSTWTWLATALGVAAVFTIDFAVVRRPRAPSLRESGLWIVGYVGLAVVFGLGIWMVRGSDYAGQFAAAWLTEYSLSVDNLFVFVIVMARFAVPPEYRQKVLLIGIGLALALRAVVVTAGVATLDEFVWAFYLLGGLLFFTAVRLLRDSDPNFEETRLLRWSRRVLPMSADPDGGRFTSRDPSGRRVFTPLFIVVVAIGTTDVLFALDSIPATLGLTDEPYLILTANFLALMGLRQLYFLIGALLDHLRYLSYGLAAILAFIGGKLVLQALAGNNVPFINGGEPVSWAPRLPIWVSLVVIFGILAVTSVAGLPGARRDDGAAFADGAESPSSSGRLGAVRVTSARGELGQSDVGPG